MRRRKETVGSAMIQMPYDTFMELLDHRDAHILELEQDVDIANGGRDLALVRLKKCVERLDVLEAAIYEAFNAQGCEEPGCIPAAPFENIYEGEIYDPRR